MLSDLKAVGIFFKYYPKRQRGLEQAVIKVNAKRNNKGLSPLSFKAKVMCEARWVERHTVLYSRVCRDNIAMSLYCCLLGGYCQQF